jgi:hypothetical protein
VGILTQVAGKQRCEASKKEQIVIVVVLVKENTLGLENTKWGSEKQRPQRTYKGVNRK